MLLCFSCEEKYQWNIDPVDGLALVVEGRLTNELREHEVKLSTITYELNGASIPVQGATVVVVAGNQQMVLKPREGEPGTYYTDSLIAVVGTVYALYVNIDGNEFFAYDAMVPGSPLEEFVPIPVADDLFVYGYIKSQESSMLEVFYDWSDTEYCNSDEPNGCHAKQVFYTLKTFDLSSVTELPVEDVVFPVGTKVTRRKYSLSDSQEKFIRSLLIETNWRGSLFDVQKGNVPSNISNGAFGYFMVNTVVTDSHTVN